MNFKQHLKIYFSFIVFILLSITGILYIYDPLHIYHKSWVSDENRLSGNMRLQAAGIINNYEFDSIILGTSMMKGTSSIEASEKIGGSFANISADGSDLYERNHILKHALNKKDIKNVIYSFDTGLDLNLRNGGKKFPLSKFDYLYDKNPINDFKAYWNNKYLECLMTFSNSTECIGGKRTLVRPSKWFKTIHKKNEKISGLQKWVEKGGRGKSVYSRIKKHLGKKKWSQEKFETNLKKTYNIIDTELLSAVKKYKNTEFNIVLPPYSRFIYSLWMKKNPKKYQLYKETIRYLVSKSFYYKNLKIYYLDNLDYISDINNYRDMRHYNTDMNSMILDHIKEDKNIKSLNELEGLFNEVDIKNTKYDLESELNFLFNAFKFRTNHKIKLHNDKFDIEGWAFSYKIDKVDLMLGKKKLKTAVLTQNKRRYNMFPQYKQINNSFKFKNIDLNKKEKNLYLFFKYRNKVIKKIKLRKKETKI